MRHVETRLVFLAAAQAFLFAEAHPAPQENRCGPQLVVLDNNFLPFLGWAYHTE